MKCPIDGAQLVMSDRGGVEIDYCPRRRGAWLERGEPGTIIERSATQAAPPPQHSGYDRGYDSRLRKKKKMGGFPGDLFDFRRAAGQVPPYGPSRVEAMAVISVVCGGLAKVGPTVSR